MDDARLSTLPLCGRAAFISNISDSAVTLFRLARWAEMPTRLPVRPTIIVIPAAIIIIITIVFPLVPGGNGRSRCRTDGTAKNRTISATHLVADGGPECATNTTTQHGVGGVTRNGTQRGGTQRQKNEQWFHIHDVNPMVQVV